MARQSIPFGESHCHFLSSSAGLTFFCFTVISLTACCFLHYLCPFFLATWFTIWLHYHVHIRVCLHYRLPFRAVRILQWLYLWIRNHSLFTLLSSSSSSSSSFFCFFFPFPLLFLRVLRSASFPPFCFFSPFPLLFLPVLRSSSSSSSFSSSSSPSTSSSSSTSFTSSSSNSRASTPVFSPGFLNCRSSTPLARGTQLPGRDIVVKDWLHALQDPQKRY
eukprot:g6452.t1